VVLEPRARGLGLGRRMITEAVAEARRIGFERLELKTFSALTTAGAIYRSLGFEVVGVTETEMWGPRIAYQHYALDL
jgi:GNAT superfamily N-acetyltransferase